MIALSIKKNSLNFLSVYKNANQLNSENYGTLNFGKKEFDESVINRVRQLKKIKNSKYPSKKCMILLDSSDVVLNKFECPDEIEPSEFLEWSHQLIFEEGDLDHYSDYHHELSPKSFLSIYIEKRNQVKYYSACSDSGLNLKVLSLGILSANYLARESFDAKNQKSYMIWAVGKDSDEILICQDNDILCILSIERSSKDISLINFIGSKKIAEDTVSLLKEKIHKDLKDFNVVNKIYMYQKSSNSDMKKIYNKKNKDAITVLNPLLKMGNIKKNKINVVESSYLAEMGYIFKVLENSDGN